MSTSVNRSAKAAAIYLGISVLCQLFYLIYDRFSHGVHSPYMTWLFAWSLGLGVLPGFAFWKIKALRSPGRICANLWNSGVAALTVSSLLRGIFEIAGTASDYQVWLMYAGGAMLLVSGVMYILRQ